MNTFVGFMASPAGRIMRILAGMGLIAWGFIGIGGTNGYIVAGVGVLPLLTGVFDICIVAPVLGYPIRGCTVRTAKNH